MINHKMTDRIGQIYRNAGRRARIAALTAALSLTGAAQTQFIECEQFNDYGGWQLESQYLAKLGSSYLIAHGLGRPVADAKTTFTVASDGTYRVWVRTKNWTAKWRPDATGAGIFYVAVDGQTLTAPLGNGKHPDWMWTLADEVALKAGEHTLTLKDVTGFDGRADAICITTEKSMPHLIAAQMKKNAPPPTETIVKADLVVAGGGIAGIATAISAARLGLQVALVQDRPVLGGNNSSEVRVHLGGWCNVPPYPRLGDVVAEIGPAKGGNAKSAANYEDDRKLAAVKAEKNIALYLNTRITEVTIAKGKKERTIESVVGVNAISGAHTRFVAPLFADCTGDAAVGALAGAWRTSGREAKSQYNEPSAPEKKDNLGMGASVQWNTRGTAVSAPFPEQPWMLPFDDKSCHAIRVGDWNWETGIGLDQIGEAETIRDYGLLVVYSNWGYVKNHGTSAKSFGTTALNWVAQVAGKRESWRIMGDFVLTENELVNRTEQPDGTCATTWTIDLHRPLTEEESHFKGLPFLSHSDNQLIYPYAIPYRCLYSKNVANLFAAGRDISVSHIALGTTRLMRTCGMMGEVVGMAASLCKANDCSPRDIYKSHFAALKDLMTKGVGKGGKNPPQTYNNQSSLDKALSKKYMRATWGRISGEVTAKQAIDCALEGIREANKAKRTKEAHPEACQMIEDFIEEIKAGGEAEKRKADLLKLHFQCLEWARHSYDYPRVERHYEAIKSIDPNYKGDDVFQARSEACYHALQDAKKFPLDEKDIRFGQTLATMGVAEKKTVHLKDYWNATNVTAALQRLVDDPEVTTIVLDQMPTPWYVTSIKIAEKVTGKRILLKSGAKVLRCPETLRHRIEKSPGSLFDLSSCQNVIIESDAEKPSDVLIGYYASREERLKWNKREGSSGIHIGHKNWCRTTRNIVIRNVRIANCECDGLSISPLWNPCEEVFVENVILDSNFRQGCSPCAYYSLYFKNVTFSNTLGGQPMAGLDVEPWEDYLSTCNLYLFDCTFSNNLGGGFLIATTTHEPILIYAKRCTFKTNGRAPQVSVISLPQGYIDRGRNVPSDIRFEDCTFESRGNTLTYGPCTMYNVSLKNCVIRDARGEWEKKHAKRDPSPIHVGMSRDFGTPDMPTGIGVSLTFDNVRIEGFERAKVLGISDEVGMMNIGKIFRGSVDWNGKKVDLSDVSYVAPDLTEPRTAIVPANKLRKPAKIPAADEAMPPSGCKLNFNGAWWLKHPAYTYYFWAEKGRTVRFDFHYTAEYDFIKVPQKPLYLTPPSGKDVKLADVVKGKTNLVYTAAETGWHRFTPALTLDRSSTIGTGIHYYVSNVQGAAFAWQADTLSDSYAKFTLADAEKPYTLYFEVPAGGKPCRIRATYGGFILKDPAGNVVDEVRADEYAGRYTFTITPSGKKAEIWSLTTPTGPKGGWTRALRFYAPLNGIFADSPDALPCVYADHFVPAVKELEVQDAKSLKDGATAALRAHLTAADIKVLEDAIAARKAFAAKKEHAALKKTIEDQIAAMKKDGVNDATQHQINDLTRAVKMHDRLARMEVKAASETPEILEAAAFCQAFAHRLVPEATPEERNERIAEALNAFGLDFPMGVLEYDESAKLAPLIEALTK